MSIPNFSLNRKVAYSGESFSIVTQENVPTGLTFNNDGTKFFVVGNQNAIVYEYTVSVGFDLSSTVAYSGNSFSVTTQETTPMDLTFNNDGTKFFIVGQQNAIVYEYTVSVGFDLSSTVAYSGESFSVTTEENLPNGLIFNNDGTKFFIAGQQNNTVYEYTVSVGFDLSSTVAYSGESFSVTTQDNNTTGLAFNNDGTKFFIVGIQNDTVYEYTVSVGFDLSSTVAYSGESFSVTTQDGDPREVTFNNNGTKFFIVGLQNDTVYEYNILVDHQEINPLSVHAIYDPFNLVNELNISDNSLVARRPSIISFSNMLTATDISVEVRVSIDDTWREYTNVLGSGGAEQSVTFDPKWNFVRLVRTGAQDIVAYAQS